MTKEKYTEAFLLVIKTLEEIVYIEKRIPTNLDCIELVNRISDDLNVNLQLCQERTVLDSEIDTELFINRQVEWENQLEIKVHYYYSGVKYGTWTLMFFSDGTFYHLGGLGDAKFILVRESESGNNLN